MRVLRSRKPIPPRRRALAAARAVPFRKPTLSA
jgi:hypothetical protein